MSNESPPFKECLGCSSPHRCEALQYCPIKDAVGEATRSTAPSQRGESNVSAPASPPSEPPPREHDYCREFGCYMNHASPPHAAAEPEKPVAWMYEDKGTKIVSHERWAQKYPYTETPLYASPSAQPDTRKALEVLVAAIKPLNPGAPESNEVEAVISKAAIIYANFVLLRTASPAQPIARLLDDLLITLRHARTFITSREKMHPDGIHLYDELTAKVAALKSAGKEST